MFKDKTNKNLNNETSEDVVETNVEISSTEETFNCELGDVFFTQEGDRIIENWVMN